MAKWYGAIGYAETVESAPGVWTDEITERDYYGEVTRPSARWSTNPNSTNDNLTITAQISIVTDPFADQKSHFMRYAEFMGTKWEITNIEPQYPRMLLTLGGVYNGPQS